MFRAVPTTPQSSIQLPTGRQYRNIRQPNGAFSQVPLRLMTLISYRANAACLHGDAHGGHHLEQFERPWPSGVDDPWRYGLGRVMQATPGLTAKRPAQQNSPVSTRNCSCLQRVEQLLYDSELSSDHFVRE